MDWMDHALCTQTDPEIFHPSQGENDKTRNAKMVCRRCPVTSECLSWAIDRPEILGIVGGTTERERQNIRRKRKDPAA